MGTPPSEKTIARFDAAQRKSIEEMYLSGARVEEVGKAHGASNVTIRFLLKQMGVRMRKAGEAARKDLTKMRFGRLVAIRDVGKQISESGKNSARLWECLCDCGNTTKVTAPALISGNTSSCGCYLKDRITETQRKDMTGVRMGTLTAVRFSHNITKSNGNKGQAYWVWKCDCGEELTAPGAGVENRLKKNGDVSCIKCSSKKRAEKRQHDYTNQRFGMLVGIKQIDLTRSPAQAKWLWQCDCGKTVERHVSNVKDADNANCGCKRKSTAADRTGERFGALVALRSLGKKPGESTYTWEFQCDCGKICQARLRDAVSGLQQSCGCRQGGWDSIGAWLEGNFRNPEIDGYFYVFPLKRYPGFAKPGITDDLENRKKDSRGEYGEIYDFIALPRLEAWLVEQATLIATTKAKDCPPRLAKTKWEGYREVRKMKPVEIFEIALSLHEELQFLGREEFAVRYLPVTPSERRRLLAAKPH